MNRKTVVNRNYVFYVNRNGQKIAVEVKAESRESARLQLLGTWEDLKREDIQDDDKDDMTNPIPGLNMAEKITGMVKYLKMEKRDLADCLGMTLSFFSQRMHRGNLTLKELEKIAHRAGAELRVYFVIGKEERFHDDAIRF